MERNTADLLAEHGVVTSDDELAHYGKLGMRWGKRKSQSTSDSDSGPAKPAIKDLSDAELKAAINRIKLERELVALTAPQVSEGRKIVGKILLNVGTKTAEALLTSQVNRAIYGGGLQSTLNAATKSKPAAPAAKPAPRPVMQFNTGDARRF